MKKYILGDCMTYLKEYKDNHLCPHCKEKMTSVVKVIKRPDAPNQNSWNEEQDKIEKSWDCLNCGFFGSQTTYKNRRKKKKNYHR